MKPCNGEYNVHSSTITGIPAARRAIFADSSRRWGKSIEERLETMFELGCEEVLRHGRPGGAGAVGKCGVIRFRLLVKGGQARELAGGELLFAKGDRIGHERGIALGCRGPSE